MGKERPKISSRFQFVNPLHPTRGELRRESGPVRSGWTLAFAGKDGI